MSFWKLFDRKDRAEHFWPMADLRKSAAGLPGKLMLAGRWLAPEKLETFFDWAAFPEP